MCHIVKIQLGASKLNKYSGRSVAGLNYINTSTTAYDITIIMRRVVAPFLTMCNGLSIVQRIHDLASCVQNPFLRAHLCSRTRHVPQECIIVRRRRWNCYIPASKVQFKPYHPLRNIKFSAIKYPYIKSQEAQIGVAI